MREKGQCGGVHTSEMRDGTGVRGLGGGRRTISFVSRAVDEDGAQDQGLRPKGSRSVPCGAHKQARGHSHTLTQTGEAGLCCGEGSAYLRRRADSGRAVHQGHGVVYLGITYGRHTGGRQVEGLW